MNANSLSALLETDISDPTDFPAATTAPGMRDLDAAFRCNVCGEFFDAPVTLPCGHCFCSQCIRNYMSDKPECPQCRKHANEGHLRLNLAMEEAVEAWKTARPATLDLWKNKVWQTEEHTKESRDALGKRKRIRLDHTGSTYSSQSEPGSSRLASSSRGGAMEKGSVSDDQGRLITTSDSKEEEIHQDENIVKCPLCNRCVRHNRINTHIDNGCPSSDVESETRSKKNEWNKILGAGSHNSSSKKGKDKTPEKDEDPLPKATYATLKDKQLKDLLHQHKLPVIGDRNAWISRHQRWVILFNANLDRSQGQRKSLQELRTDLKNWEAQKKVKRQVVNDPAAYQKTHRSEFAQLIEAARPKRSLDLDQHKTPRTVADASPDLIVVDSEEEILDGS